MNNLNEQSLFEVKAEKVVREKFAANQHHKEAIKELVKQGWRPAEEMEYKLKQANEQIARLESDKPDMFWLSDDPEMSFDSPEELAEYYLDSYSSELNPVIVKLARGVSLPNAKYEFKYNSETNEWVYKILEGNKQ